MNKKETLPNKFSDFFIKPFNLIFFTLIILLCPITWYTQGIYNIFVYFIVLWGGALLIYMGLFQRKALSSRGIVLLGVFLAANIITLLVNREESFIKNSFIMLFCVVYFFIYCVSDKAPNRAAIYRQIYIICWTLVWITFCLSIISLVTAVAGLHWTIDIGDVEAPQGINIRGAGFVQLIGVYSGAIVLAVMSILSIFSSITIIYIKRQKKNLYKYSKVCQCFLVGNIIIQFICFCLTNSMTPLLAFFCAIGLGSYIFLYHILKVKSQKKRSFRKVWIEGRSLIGALIGSVLIVFLVFCAMKACQVGVYTVILNGSEMESSTKSRSVEVALENPSGRYEIWTSVIEKWKQSPLFGYSAGGTVITARYAEDTIVYKNVHNGYLSILLANGLTGLVPILLFGGLFLFDTIKLLFTRFEIIPLLAFVVIIFILAYNMGQSNFVMERTFLMVILCAYMGYINYFVNESKIVGASKCNSEI